MRFTNAFAASLASALFLSALPASAAFSRTPWVNDATSNSITIAWEAGFGAGPTELLNWGVGTATDQGVTGTLVTGSVYTAKITGLSPSTKYSYKVTSGSDISSVVSVVTAPAAAEPFRFVSYGDNRTDATAHAAVVAAVVAKTPDFVINTGDLAALPIYTEFFQIESPLISTTPFFPVPGNHDTSTTVYTQGGVARPAYYSYKWGNAFFIAISTEDDYSTGSTQYNWVESQLQAAKADPSVNWIFAYHHYPVYSSSTHGSTAAMQTSLNNLYKQYGVDIVFNGHDHDYERSELDGVIYLVTGGGGAPLYGAGTSCPGHVFSDSVNSFATVDIDGGHLVLTAYDTNGNAIDTRTIDKTVTTPTPTPTASGTPSGTPTPNPTGTPGGNGADGGGKGGCNVGGLDLPAASGMTAMFAGALVALLLARKRRGLPT